MTTNGMVLMGFQLAKESLVANCDGNWRARRYGSDAEVKTDWPFWQSILPDWIPWLQG